MEVISHGRRKGSLRSNPSPSSSVNEQRAGQATVISGGEWFRLKSTALGEVSPSQPVSDRKEMYERSKAIVKHWENTIEGQRLKKLQARQLREEKEETERIKIDLEEAKYQADKRKAAIERAKTLLYYQTDRVKQFHGALMLSEVLREREAQLNYKKRRQELVKSQDNKYLKQQQKDRENGILVDMKAAEERARQRESIANFQQMQINDKQAARDKERQVALDAQKQIDQEVAEFHASQRARELKEHTARLEHRRQLDKVLADKKKNEERQKEQNQAEEEEIEIFAAAKRKMTKLRKQKEVEIFREFQSHQQRMGDLLHSQQQQATSNEDQRIALAMAEQHAKRDAEELAKQQKFVEATRDIHHHMLEQMREQEEMRKEQAELDQQLLKQRIIQDQKFHSQQLEKAQKAASEAKQMQEYHKSQVTERRARTKAERKEQLEYTKTNMNLLKVEEDQFQQYAESIIQEAKSRGAPIQPLVKAIQAGTGGGRGPVMAGTTDFRPSYQVTDSTRVEMPAYQPKLMQKDTQKRMGFTW